ncbi:MAG TPA: YggS family pyridoxal phosphate-dependent enzyme [bacterium]|jgi:pyridoxal phosphate enzyme (YggS family)|nr:YggS family pyridoxal phosphate-dependent enzyme [bacterium]
MTSTIAGNLDGVDQRIKQACERAGRLRETVTLVAVTKFQNPDSVRSLAALGLVHFAESRVQEAQTKVPGLKGLGTWHFIGHLQTNKARQAAELFDVIQSVDSLRLAQKLDEAASALGRRLRVFAQVNCSQEPQKQGFSLDSAAEGAAAMARMPHLKLEGLMGMAPAGDAAAARHSFRGLRELRVRLAPELGPLLLSMGMSGDFEAAIEEGADLVRIGSALFP